MRRIRTPVSHRHIDVSRFYRIPVRSVLEPADSAWVAHENSFWIATFLHVRCYSWGYLWHICPQSRGWL